MTDEHKRKMAEGRAKKALERKDAANLKPADLPAGADRQEAHARVRDHLEEQIEKRDAALEIEPIAREKLAKREYEMMKYATDRTGVQNARPDREYLYFPLSQFRKTTEAQLEVDRNHDVAMSKGWMTVSGDMKEDERYKGNAGAAGTTLRGKGDCILHWMPKDEYDRMVAKGNEEHNRRFGYQEQDVVRFAERAGIGGQMHGVAGDFSQDPLMNRVAGAAGRVETFRRQPSAVMKSNFTEGDIRRGSIPGIPAPGTR